MNNVPNKITPAEALRHAALSLEGAALELESRERNPTGQHHRPIVEVIESLRGVPELINTAVSALARISEHAHPAVAATKLLDNDGNVIG